MSGHLDAADRISTTQFRLFWVFRHGKETGRYDPRLPIHAEAESEEIERTELRGLTGPPDPANKSPCSTVALGALNCGCQF
jgi:hypothetical protein